MKIININLIFLFNLIFKSIASNYFEMLVDRRPNNDPSEHSSLVYFENSMTSSEAFETVQVDSFWECKQAGFTTNAKTISMVRESQGSRVTCFISMKMVYSMKLKAMQGAITFAFYDNSLYLGEDGLFYHVVKKNYFLSSAREKCQEEVNGRLAMTKTKLQFESLWKFRIQNNYHEESHRFFLDLTYNKNLRKAVWADGTPYNESEISRYYKIREDPDNSIYEAVVRDKVQVIEPYPPFTTSYIICQGNPMGQE